ncbi:MAG: 50S ribosomal protein L4 [Candidatus Sumerlaeia bacterium]|nr:50S ribosomal protein L4 [Candidatus Sumerlaeia bacterium]
MAEVKTIDAGSGASGTATLDEATLLPKTRRESRGFHPVVLRDAVIQYEANARVGTVQTKERHFVSGNTKKMFKQKHTGNARQGDGTVRPDGSEPIPRDQTAAQRHLPVEVQGIEAGRILEGVEPALRFHRRSHPGKAVRGFLEQLSRPLVIAVQDPPVQSPLDQRPRRMTGMGATERGSDMLPLLLHGRPVAAARQRVEQVDFCISCHGTLRVSGNEVTQEPGCPRVVALLVQGNLRPQEVRLRPVDRVRICPNIVTVRVVEEERVLAPLIGPKCQESRPLSVLGPFDPRRPAEEIADRAGHHTLPPLIAKCGPEKECVVERGGPWVARAQRLKLHLERRQVSPPVQALESEELGPLDLDRCVPGGIGQHRAKHGFRLSRAAAQVGIHPCGQPLSLRHT